MGWESGISLGASAVGGYATMENAKSQSKAMQLSAEYTASNIANQTSRNIGTLETSFLKGGIALTGTGGPQAAIEAAASQGTTDINRTISNANASIEDTMNKARTQALSGIAGAYSKLGAGTITTAVNQAYQGSWLQSAWNGLAGNLDPSPQGSLDDIGTGTGRLY